MDEAERLAIAEAEAGLDEAEEASSALAAVDAFGQAVMALADSVSNSENPPANSASPVVSDQQD